MSVELEPSSVLSFHIGSFGQTVREILVVKNPNQQSIFFKVKTTAPKQYSVRPNAGRIESGSSVQVQINLQPSNQEYPPDFKCKDKFLIQSILIPPEMADGQVTWNDLESASPEMVHQKKIRVAYVLPSSEVAQDDTQVSPPPQSTLLSVPEINDRAPVAAPVQVQESESPPPYNDDQQTFAESETQVTQAEVIPQYAKDEEIGYSVTTLDEKPKYAEAEASAAAANSAETARLQSELTEARNTIARLQKSIETYKRNIKDSNDTLRQRKTTSSEKIKLPSNIQPLDAVHQHLASLQVATPNEGYPLQSVVIIAIIVFLITWLFF